MESLFALFVSLKEKIYSVYGLATGFLFVFVLNISFFSYFEGILEGLEYVTLIKIVELILCEAVWLLMWFRLRNNFRSNTQGKIGFVIAINAENEKQKDRIKIDFYENIVESFKRNNLLNKFNIIVYDNFKSEKVSDTINNYELKKNELIANESSPHKLMQSKEVLAWTKLQSKIKAHIYIHGKIKERYDGENRYILDLSFLVKHSSIPVHESASLSRRALNIFPRKISFFEKFELSGFSFSADLIYLSVRYLTGWAAFVSGDPIMAVTLHEGLEQEIDRLPKPLPPQIAEVKRDLKDLLLQEKLWIALNAYYFKKDNNEANEVIDECLHLNSDHYNSLVAKSVFSFSQDKDPITALQYLNKARKFAKGDYTWIYNKAFLLMYMEKFDKGLDCYKKIYNKTFVNEDDVINQVVEFVLKTYSDEGKVQCLFILGIIYYKKLDNCPMALEYLENFVAIAACDEKYSSLIEVANSYLVEIKRVIGIN